MPFPVVLSNGHSLKSGILSSKKHQLPLLWNEFGSIIQFFTRIPDRNILKTPNE